MSDLHGALLIDLDAAPLLHRDSVAKLVGNELRIETPYWEFTIFDQAARLAELLSRADGVAPLHRLASEVGLELGTVARLLEPLMEEGAVIDASASLRADDDAFLDAFQLECRLMMRALAEQPFWRLVLSGDAPRTLILGWGIEFAYFVEAANEYMPLGIAQALESAQIREAFSRHYAEEAMHSAIFQEGLIRCGLDRGRLACAPPLATTRALVNLLTEHALEGAVTYAAGFAVMQPEIEPAERGQVRDFYAELQRLYPFALPMFEAFERHACLDLELGHHDTAFCTLHALRGVSRPERRRALDAARATAEAFTLFFEGILDAYHSAEADLPRRPAWL